MILFERTSELRHRLPQRRSLDASWLEANHRTILNTKTTGRLRVWQQVTVTPSTTGHRARQFQDEISMIMENRQRSKTEDVANAEFVAAN